MKLPTFRRRSILIMMFAAPLVRVVAGTPAVDPSQPVGVITVKPSRAEIFRFITLPGSIKANQSAVIYAKVPGYLKSIDVDRGDMVRRGQELGEIEVPELAADLAKHQAELRVAELELRRVREASSKAPDLVVAQTVDTAEGRAEIARANVERTTTLLGFARIVAPFSGVVTARHLDPGAFVPAATSGSAAQTAAILTLMDLDVVRVQVPVIELEASRIAKGQPVQLTVEGLQGRVFEGAVSRHSYALDDATRTLLVEADLPNPNHELRPGMYATVKLGVERHANALTIPIEALALERSSPFAFIIEEGKAKRIPLKTGFIDGIRAEILSGLAGGETVIVSKGVALVDGAAVQVKEAR